MLKNKTIVLGITGGIAAYKMVDLASKLSKNNCDVHTIMTQNATKFITPLTFETLTGNRCIVDTFDRNFEWNVKHISLAQKADLVLIAPATANFIAKMANGIADDMLSTLCLAATCEKVVSPSMNTNMYDNPITQRNIQTLKDFGISVIDPDSGFLACGDVGKGRLPDIQVFYDYIIKKLAFKKDLKDMNVLITAGPTQESLDPVRFITNHSSGKMGYELALNSSLRGANVTLITGPTNLKVPFGVNAIHINSSKQMFEQVKKHYKNNQIIVKSAAVSDYTPADFSKQKIKKSDEEFNLKLIKTQDILKYLGEKKLENQVLCGFAMETQNLVENANIKLNNKNLDIIVANNLNDKGAGFKIETNLVTVLFKDGKILNLPILKKSELAKIILDNALEIYFNKNKGG